MIKAEQNVPLGKLFAILTKQYLGTLSEKLEHLPIDRYYYSFWIISENDGKINSKQLGDIVRTDKVMVVRIIKYLTEMNLVEKRQHPIDKRSFLLHITENGKKYVPDVTQALIETDQEFTEAFDANADDDFFSGITKLVNKLGPVKEEKIVLDYKRIKK